MPRKSSPLSQWTQYVAARLAVMGMTAFPVDDNLRTAAALGRLMFHLDRRHRERAMAHVRMAFPEKSEQDCRELVRESFEHFVQLAVEVIHTPLAIHRDTWVERIVLKDLEPVIQSLNAGRPALMITGHIGNWELLGYFLATIGYPMHAIARPIDNPLINQWLLGIRERQGLQVITKWDASDRMLEVLGGGGVLGFIADQNAGDRGIFVPFFGKMASAYKSIGLLAIHQNIPVICGYAQRIGPGFRHEMGVTDVIEPQDWANQPDPLFYITARYMRAMELAIRKRPAQYLWMHRRWKSRPRYERMEQPMPARTEQALTQLPWMTPPLLARLREPVAKGGQKP